LYPISNGGSVLAKRDAKTGLQILEKRLNEIKNGNTAEREAFIRDYMPFIVKCVSKCIDKYLESMECDEFSIALQAFNEAIERYDFEKGNFIAYANLVISSRIKDYQKKESKGNTIPMSFLGGEKRAYADNIVLKDDFTRRIDIKNQMQGFVGQLQEFGVTLEQLVEESPKHLDTRRRAIEVALLISTNDDLKRKFEKNKKLPYGEIRKKMDISQKVLRKSNRFILAAVLILLNDWPELKAQLPGSGKEGGGN